MTADLGAIRARLAAATPGSWEIDEDGWIVTHGYGFVVSAACPQECCSPKDVRPVIYDNPADADLIAHAPADLAALCDEVDRLRATVQRVRAVAEGWASRGQHQIVYAEAVPEEVRDALVDAGAEWVNKSRIVLYALDGAS